MLYSAKQSIQTSVKALGSNKARSFLTMLGIIIGVGAVIVIISVGAGAQSLILSQIESLGTDLVGILPGNSGDDGPPTAAMGISITTLKYEDILALGKKSNVPNALAVVGYTNGSGSLMWKSNSYQTSLVGTMASYITVNGGELAEGRFFTEEEERNMSRGIVLGYTPKQELFGDTNPIGQQVRIKNHNFEVIGYMAERGTVAFQNYDDQVLIPLKTMQNLIAGVNHLGMARVKIDNESNADLAIRDIKATLRERHDIDDQTGVGDDFTVRSSADAMEMITTITNALRYFLAAMAALSLVVGGIGIMNIMLVTVTERTREVGLRKAIGANNFDIMFQFLTEAVVITLIGGIIGIVGGIFISYLVSVVANFLDYNWEFSVSFFSILAGVLVSTAVGIIFGIYPARKASKLQPVEALRYE